ncbi:hypothetical protein DWB68_11620 [Galactobacter valiniphilus]|uniref:Uncharacterized protein n=1 Tax=Galactobacter valiniphilus TaxID=2676122 RepID=A0A399JC36_9MICC|nr:hypothetical protein [Galactobacter valiniphilus]RII41592.1 hypothetical protein DWB68_11620 [Galactobacter valiniphilus]
MTRTAPDATIVTRTGPKSAGAPLKDPYAEADREWTAAEDARARELAADGFEVKAIAVRMRIDQKQVVRRLARTVYGYSGRDILKPLGNGSGHRKGYEKEELDLMRSFIESGVAIEDVAARLNRSVDGVVWRALNHRMLPPGI